MAVRGEGGQGTWVSSGARPTEGGGGERKTRGGPGVGERWARWRVNEEWDNRVWKMSQMRASHCKSNPCWPHLQTVCDD